MDRRVFLYPNSMKIKKIPNQSSFKHFARSLIKLQKTNSDLKKQLVLCRSLSDEAADAICTVNLAGTMTYANTASAKLLKTPIKKLLGTHFSKYLDKESLAKGYEYFKIAKS